MPLPDYLCRFAWGHPPLLHIQPTFSVALPPISKRSILVWWGFTPTCFQSVSCIQYNRYLFYSCWLAPFRNSLMSIQFPEDLRHQFSISNRPSRLDVVSRCPHRLTNRLCRWHTWSDEKSLPQGGKEVNLDPRNLGSWRAHMNNTRLWSFALCSSFHYPDCKRAVLSHLIGQIVSSQASSIFAQPLYRHHTSTALSHICQSHHQHQNPDGVRLAADTRGYLAKNCLLSVTLGS